jgi:hypothetical protein
MIDKNQKFKDFFTTLQHKQKQKSKKKIHSPNVKCPNEQDIENQRMIWNEIKKKRKLEDIIKIQRETSLLVSRNKEINPFFNRKIIQEKKIKLQVVEFGDIPLPSKEFYSIVKSPISQHLFVNNTSVKVLDTRDTSVKVLDTRDTSVKVLDTRDTSVRVLDTIDSVKVLDTRDTSVRVLDTRDTNVKVLDTRDTSVRVLDTIDTNVKVLDTIDTSVKVLDSIDTSVRVLDTRDTSVKVLDNSLLQKPFNREKWVFRPTILPPINYQPFSNFYTVRLKRLLKNKEKISNFICLIGPKGTGKTHSIYSVATLLNLNIIETNVSQQQTNAQIQKLFKKQTRIHKKQDLFLVDDFDVKFKKDSFDYTKFINKDLIIVFTMEEDVLDFNCDKIFYKPQNMELIANSIFLENNVYCKDIKTFFIDWDFNSLNQYDYRRLKLIIDYLCLGLLIEKNHNFTNLDEIMNSSDNDDFCSPIKLSSSKPGYFYEKIPNEKIRSFSLIELNSSLDIYPKNKPKINTIGLLNIENRYCQCTNSKDQDECKCIESFLDSGNDWFIEYEKQVNYKLFHQSQLTNVYFDFSDFYEDVDSSYSKRLNLDLDYKRIICKSEIQRMDSLSKGRKSKTSLQFHLKDLCMKEYQELASFTYE